MRPFLRPVIFSLVLAGLLALLLNAQAPVKVAAQQPTGSIPTVTGTVSGPYITVIYDGQINVRSGPSTFSYPAIGVLLPQEMAPALGRSPGGEWIMIRYTGVPGNVGWVYGPYVKLPIGASLPVVEVPPTPTPATTATLDPTLVAAFLPQFTPTRLPTFTAPGPLILPTYESSATRASGVPLGLVIVLLALIGSFGALISFLRGR